MSKVEFRPLTIMDLEALQQTNHADNAMRVSGIAFVMLSDGEPVAAGGIMRGWQGTGHAWTVNVDGKLSPRLMRRAHKFIIEQLDIIRRALDFQRIEAETLAHSKKHCAWLERFGFEFEGIAKKYFEGKDYARYAWVR